MRRFIELKKQFSIQILAVVFAYISVIACYTFTDVKVYAEESYKGWLQSDSRWANMYLGSSGENMSQIGCAVTSVAMLVVHSQSRSEKTFNPGILCEYLSANGGFDSGGNIYWGTVSGLISEFTFSKSVIFKGTTKEEKAAELNNYLMMGYYAVVCVKYGDHWVAVDSVSGSNVYIMDPAASKYTNLFSAYGNEGVTHIKLFKGIGSTGAESKKTGTYITNDSLNLRASAGTYYTVLDIIPAGTRINVTAISGNWGSIIHNGKLGWVCLDYANIDNTEGTTTTVTTSQPQQYNTGLYMVTSDNGLYYRAGPGTSNTSYGLLTYGTYIVVNSVSDGWGNIEYNGKNAWIYLEYAQYISPPETTTVTTPSLQYKTGNYMVTSDNGLYYRSGPGGSNTAYGILPYGTFVTVTDVKDNWGNISYNGYNAWICLEYTLFTQEVETTVAETTTEVPQRPVIKGDADNNNEINVYDIVYIRKFLLKMIDFNEDQKEAADINNDGVIDDFDYNIIKNMIINKIS